ncbi:helix-turn-helix transcriptional regulator [Rhodoferax sp.]|uniref:helix-turn-helix transcriptional regulator n=1 Tax=Rhodoferax sp. TaxID=50421 RepID=UPI00374D7F00
MTNTNQWKKLDQPLPAVIPTAQKLVKTERRPRSLRQPLELINVPGALLRLELVEVLVGLQHSAIYKHIQAGIFPQPVRRGARCTRWTSDSIRLYLAGQ